MVCTWCKTDAEQALQRGEGPHATWCVHYRSDWWRRPEPFCAKTDGCVFRAGHSGACFNPALR